MVEDAKDWQPRRVLGASEIDGPILPPPDY